MPLSVPYEDSPPEVRILNAVAAGLLFEGRSDKALELGMPKTDFARALRSLKNDGAIYVGAGGRYRLSFHTSNFPNIVAK
jgi:DNA-binding IclR family transcriptional regulator